MHPAHGDQVVQAFEEAVAHTVFRQTMHARVMAHRHLRDGEPVHERERGEKSMHAMEELQSVHDGTAEDLQRATGIVNLIARDRARTALAIFDDSVRTRLSCRFVRHPHTRSNVFTWGSNVPISAGSF